MTPETRSVSSSVLVKTALPLLAGGVLLGVLGTMLVLPRLRPAPSVPLAGEAHREANSEHAHSQEPGHAEVTLSEEAARAGGVRVEPLRLSRIGEDLTVPGTVEISPNRGAKITPPAPGKVVRLLVNPGDHVREGQDLLVLDSYDVAQAHAAVRQAQAGVLQARASIQTADAEVDQAHAGVRLAQAEAAQAETRQRSAETALRHQQELARAGAFSQAPLQSAQAELNEAQSELLKAQTELQSHTGVLQRAERLFREELISRTELEQAQLEQKQDEAHVAQAGNRMELAKRTLEREQRVFSGDLLSKQALQAAEAEVRAAIGEVQKARQGVLRARQDVRRAQKGSQAARTALQGAEAARGASFSNLFALEGGGHTEGSGGLLTIKAPLSGLVAERTATVGEAVERTSSLMVIENLNTVSVVAAVPEGDVARVRANQPVSIRVASYPQRRFAGIVQSLAGRVDEKTRTLPVRCLVENPGGLLRPEMFAQVTLRVGKTAPALTVPNSAIEEDGTGHYLYFEASGRFERRKVLLGKVTKTHSEIRSGAKAGDRIAVEGIFVLKSEANRDKLKEEE